MRRAEAAALLGAALVCVTAGVTWLFGAYGLTGAGVVLTGAVLFLVDVRE